MFEKLKAVVSGAPVVPGQLTKLFEPLNKNNPDVAKVVVPYVAFGQDPAALMTVGANGAQAIDSQCLDWSGRKLLNPLAEKSDQLTADQWVRLGQVYALAPSMVTAAAKWPASVPVWFMTLLQKCQQSINKVSIWDPRFIQSVLASGGVDASQMPVIALTTFFNSFDGPYYYPDLVHRWADARDSDVAQRFVAFVQANVDEVPPALAVTNAANRVAIAKWLRLYPQLIPPLAPTLGEWAISTAKTVREAAVDLIAGLSEPLRSQTLAVALDQGTPANLAQVVNQAARMGEAGQSLLRGALGQGRGGKRDELLSAALDRSEVVATTPDVAIAVPPAPPLDVTPVGDDFVNRLQAIVARRVESLQKSVSSDPKNNWQKKQLDIWRSMDRGYCQAVRAWLNGQGPQPKNTNQIENSAADLSVPLSAAVRFALYMQKNDRLQRLTLHTWTLRRVAGTNYDLRTLAEALQRAGAADAIGDVGGAMFGWNGLEGRAPQDVWPFFAEHPERLDQALGLTPRLATQRYEPDWVGIALKILQMFPVLPTKYVPVLAQYATGEGKTYRRTAQQLLETQTNAVAIAVQTLSNGKGEVRAAGASWLGRIGDPGAVQPLRDALAKEKREQPQAAMLNALGVLGDDISAHLTPQALATAAKKGLAAKPPAGMEWLPLDALPACRWADGTPVDTATIRWWATLAVKLKDPLGAGLIPLYVSLLDEPSRQALGTFALDAWIARDTQTASDEDCRAYATANVDARYNQYQDWAKRYPQYYATQAAMTKDQVFDELRREKGGQYLGSAIGEKGLLALTVGAPGHNVYAAAQRYIRDHGQRRAQVEALVTAASGNPDPAAIQLVLSVARKFKQETVRLKAAALAEDIAERSGWTMDELADRTIPTAGFDDTGVLQLSYGPRTFTGRIARSPKTGAFTISVFNPDGKPITALPKPGVSDDEAVAGESRKQLTTSKKELGQVVTLQTSRLFEAMCLERTWDATSWREYLLDHPVMSHLVSTLVWQAHDGQTDKLFRPSDGELVDIDDDAYTLGDDASVSLAHVATITSDEANLWRAHLSDYQVEPLFNQFDAVAPLVLGDVSAIDDHKGWLSDTFAIRGRATKRGFQRGAAEDGGCFYEYYKSLPGARLRVVIEFTGSYMPEEQMAAAVTDLAFERDGRRLPLRDVPKILLAESYADYVFIAQAGVFDKDWESKSGI